jgi:hypothetical protein
MRRRHISCVFLIGSLMPAFAWPVAPMMRETNGPVETIAARGGVHMRAPKMRAPVRTKVSRSTSVSVTIIRKERKPRKKPYAIPDIPKQK